MKRTYNAPIKPKNFPDCLKCVWRKEVEYGLIDCQRPWNRNTVPTPNCKINKVDCKYFKDEKL